MHEVELSQAAGLCESGHSGLGMVWQNAQHQHKTWNCGAR